MTKDKLARELATRVNKMINIPLINEETEQVFFELMIGIILGIIFDHLGLDNK